MEYVYTKSCRSYGTTYHRYEKNQFENHRYDRLDIMNGYILEDASWRRSICDWVDDDEIVISEEEAFKAMVASELLK